MQIHVGYLGINVNTNKHLRRRERLANDVMDKMNILEISLYFGGTSPSKCLFRATCWYFHVLAETCESVVFLKAS